MSMDPLPQATDVFVIGGGPAGLAAAIAARRVGLSVVVADRARPPIDKACGEGLMPDALAAARQLGVHLDAGPGVPFRGIRFIDGELASEAAFATTPGRGLERTTLHRILSERAQHAGVATLWHTPVDGLHPEGVKIGERLVRCHWVIGADGVQSKVRAWAGIGQAWTGARRTGVRQRFRVRHWTDFVEVHWGPRCQAYVTPTAPDEICLATVGSAAAARISDLPVLFPRLAERLAGAEPISPVRGAPTLTSRLHTVVRRNVALIGDASGSVDAVTGEGVSLAFRQAVALGDALAARDLTRYDADHRRLHRAPRRMARLLLLMDSHDRFRRRMLRALSAQPDAFGHLLAAHIGDGAPAALWRSACSLAVRLLAPGPPRRAA